MVLLSIPNRSPHNRLRPRLSHIHRSRPVEEPNTPSSNPIRCPRPRPPRLRAPRPYQHDTPAWAPLSTPIEHATIALLTSAGIYIEGDQPPFDLDRERANPTRGDPTYRLIPRNLSQDRVGAAHLHINTRDLYEDIDVALPLRTFAQLEAEGRFGRLADEHYSFMGFQDSNLNNWRTDQAPEVAQRLQDAGVSALVLAPA